MYVTNEAGGPSSYPHVTAYAAGSNGNVTPMETINGANTGLSNPQGISVDASGNIYVANSNNTVTIYPAGTNGNIAPSKTISGSKTKLGYPYGLALDPTGKEYVADYYNSITVYPAGANGNAKPTQRIYGSTTKKNKLDCPASITIDPSNDIYVGNVCNNSITEYAAGATKNVPPINVISGSYTGNSGPYGIAIH